MKLWNKKLDKINRALHRDLGYLFIGLTLIYGISGVAVILRHLDIDIIHIKTKTEKVLSTNLSIDQLTTYWTENKNDLPKLTKIKQSNESNEIYLIRVKGGSGSYNRKTGNLLTTRYKTNRLIKFANDIHYNVGGRFTWMALLYAFILIFFAISGAIIVKGRKSFMKRGIWFAIIGFAVPLIFYFLF